MVSKDSLGIICCCNCCNCCCCCCCNCCCCCLIIFISVGNGLHIFDLRLLKQEEINNETNKSIPLLSPSYSFNCFNRSSIFLYNNWFLTIFHGCFFSFSFFIFFFL